MNIDDMLLDGIELNHPGLEEALKTMALEIVKHNFPLTMSKLRVKLREEAKSFGHDDMGHDINICVRRLVKSEAVNAFALKAEDSDVPKICLIPKNVKLFDV